MITTSRIIPTLKSVTQKKIHALHICSYQYFAGSTKSCDDKVVEDKNEMHADDMTIWDRLVIDRSSFILL